MTLTTRAFNAAFVRWWEATRLRNSPWVIQDASDSAERVFQRMSVLKARANPGLGISCPPRGTPPYARFVRPRPDPTLSNGVVVTAIVVLLNGRRIEASVRLMVGPGGALAPLATGWLPPDLMCELAASARTDEVLQDWLKRLADWAREDARLIIDDNRAEWRARHGYSA